MHKLWSLLSTTAGISARLAKERAAVVRDVARWVPVPARGQLPHGWTRDEAAPTDRLFQATVAVNALLEKLEHDPSVAATKTVVSDVEHLFTNFGPRSISELTTKPFTVKTLLDVRTHPQI